VDLLQLELRVPADRLDEADALLALLGAISVTHRPGSDEAILEPAPGTSPAWRVTRVVAQFSDRSNLSREVAVLRRQFGRDVDISVSPLADSQWQPALRAEPTEIRIGSRLLIAGVSQTVARSPNRRIVRLHRGLGFGTGQHATTRLCLAWLESELHGGESILDYGCGSGILATAALCLGAGFAWAVDIEPQAIRATLDNGKLNGFSSEQLWVGLPQDLPTLHADVVMANILADTLIKLNEQLTARTAPGGTLVLAGVLATQCDVVAAAYADRFAMLRVTELDGWARIDLSTPLE